MKLAVFGGSFNPPHQGHLAAAIAFCEECEPDLLLIIPAGIPPHKTAVFCCTNEQRMEMIRRSFASLSTPFAVSDLEMKREGKSYTVDTLLQLKKEYSDPEIFLYCGSDMLLSFPTWHRYETVLSLCTLCVMKREAEVPAFDEAVERLSPLCASPIRVIGAPVFEESSTHIRGELKRGRIPSGLVKEAAEYIVSEGLYR